MNNSYDSYNYLSYWTNREYEHKSEVHALKDLINAIPDIGTIADIGGGYGRLAPYYSSCCDKAVIVDPSKKLLRQAKKKLNPSSNLEFINSDIEHLEKKLTNKKIDTVIMVRVMHHIKNADKAIESISNILPKNGYLILEFANKLHGKAVIKNICTGNLTYSFEIFPNDINTTQTKKGSLPFKNYHPEKMIEILNKNKLFVVQKRSVSNIRLPILKKILPTNLLLKLESTLQKPFSNINFGPSVFVLAQKA